MAFTTQQQELYDFARNSLPSWFFQIPRSEEVLNAFVAIFDRVRTNIGERATQSLILTATGVWLEQHSADRGTQRQDGETDPALRARIRNAEKSVTRPDILSLAQDIVDAELIAGAVVGVELKRDKAFFGTFTARTGTGGVFTAGTGTLFQFTPTVQPPNPIEVGFLRSGSQGNPRIVFASSSSPANDGTFEVTALDGNALVYTNASGVAEADGGVGWTLNRYDVEGNNRDGRKRAYLGRGYRMSGNKPISVDTIIPRGSGPFSTDGTVNSVEEMQRQKTSAGVVGRAERRET